MSEHLDAPRNGMNGANTRPLKILLVDDEERFRKNLTDRLALRGFKTRDYNNGEDAIRAVRQS